MKSVRDLVSQTAKMVSDSRPKYKTSHSAVGFFFISSQERSLVRSSKFLQSQKGPIALARKRGMSKVSSQRAANAFTVPSSFRSASVMEIWYFSISSLALTAADKASASVAPLRVVLDKRPCIKVMIFPRFVVVMVMVPYSTLSRSSVLGSGVLICRALLFKRAFAQDSRFICSDMGIASKHSEQQGIWRVDTVSKRHSPVGSFVVALHTNPRPFMC